ncbi:YxeA family protein [Enterococcus asini]|uniref:YxeA family protein n=1 Tax=Enterococcus asini TaxID=57732 RepID=UPI0026DC9BE7|nr:YxeA family protein [Enterococcus asini]
MKTIIKLAAGVLLLLGGAALFSSHAPSDVAQVIDQLNPLLPTKDLYVKTTTPDFVNDYGTAAYKQMAADQNGDTREIQFSGMFELKTDRYLKLTAKGAHVETYEEVQKAEVPKKALAAIEKA